MNSAKERDFERGEAPASSGSTTPDEPVNSSSGAVTSAGANSGNGDGGGTGGGGGGGGGATEAGSMTTGHGNGGPSGSGGGGGEQQQQQQQQQQQIQQQNRREFERMARDAMDVEVDEMRRHHARLGQRQEREDLGGPGVINDSNDHGDPDDSPTNGGNSGGSSSHVHSSSSGSPVRRIPSVLRPPTAHMGTQQASTGYEHQQAPMQRHASSGPVRDYDSQRAMYVGAGYPPSSSMSMRAYYGDDAMARGYARERMMNANTGNVVMGVGAQSSPRDSGNDQNAGLKRRLPHHEAPQSRHYDQAPQAPMGSSISSGSSRQQQQHDDAEDDDDPLRNETRGSHGPRDEARYETWTSKQLRKKCSHLKLRGLKNVKKHVMVEALYRYYRNLRQKEAAESSTRAPHRAELIQGSGGNDGVSMRDGNGPHEQFRQRYEHANSGQQGGSFSANPAASTRSGRSSQSEHTTTCSDFSSGSRSLAAALQRKQAMREAEASGIYNVDEEMKTDALDNEIQVTSDDVIRLVDVVLSPEFVDRLATELSRWQFWVDIRGKYISAQKSAASHSYGGHMGGHEGQHVSEWVAMRASSTSGHGNTRGFQWSSMQLWEIWKELTFAYTKTCFEFTAAGMKSEIAWRIAFDFVPVGLWAFELTLCMNVLLVSCVGGDERDYIKFCDGRPDVYYLHQRLHARPDLLHLIKSNEYIDEKCTSDATDNINASNSASMMVVTASSPSNRAHKRLKRIMPAPDQPIGVYSSGSGSSSSGNGEAHSATSQSHEYSLSSNGAENGNSPNAGSTENSETTGEEGSSDKINGGGSLDAPRREAMAGQKYFGLLLQNFEAIFESLHNKKVLLAALRKDPNAPDHLIADLHDDIHVLSALKKEFRNKLRRTLE
ncbi:TPA: hypothetical protein N0F65_009525 [Lagenidium giganteum]|uniref:Uncharacterized protein n=1 Tax=Lagenidium giganteum TaxID=4803 RepID=A0AAV2YWJ7_9STRA|nr:TPA: hypothetical protein N0F65_009525 [Lagenidium giganteum]